MKKKNITNDDLALMVQKGFNGVDDRFNKIEAEVKGGFSNLNSRMAKVEIRLDNLENEVEEIRKHQIAHTIYRDEFEKLQNRVKALERLLISKG